MKKNQLLLLLVSIAIIAGGIVLFSILKEKNQQKNTALTAGFNNYISGYTSGIVSIKTNIRFKLASPASQAIEPGQLIDQELFDFSPSISGECFWVDNQTIEFRPDELLKNGQLYQTIFYLGKISEVPKEFQKFKFQFQTAHQQFKFQNTRIDPYSAKDLTDNLFSASILAADFIENEILEKLVKASVDGEEKEIIWEHDQANLVHGIKIEHILRTEDEKELKISINGSDFSMDDQELIFEIPSTNNFKVMQMSVVQQPNQHILIRFSDPILKSQDLRGLITVAGEKDLRFSIEGNQIKAYTPYHYTGSKEVRIAAGIQNSNGFKIKKDVQEELTFQAIKPNVRLLGNGIIMPNSKGLFLPFEAVNLSAVDVKVVKIFENNIAQFLQVNNLDESYQLKRVGRIILQKKIELLSPNVIDYGQWNAFSIDLAELIKSDPGALYRVSLNFKKKYSLYPCENTTDQNEDIEENWDDTDETESSYWDSADSYYEQDYSYYNWRERENPCDLTYFYDKEVARNILASTLGIIAKSGADHQLKIAVTDLNTTQPLSGVDVEIYNYQQQLINSQKTDGKGLVSIDLKQKPFLLIAKHNNQRGYLKLDDGSSLSLSKFDVSGKEIQKGIKGYIYGERGVWRPGDSLFISFILEDKNKVLPENHPVQFEMYDPNGQLKKRMISTKSSNGFYSFKTATEESAPTGNWLAKIKIGGSVFSKSLRIETVKPNRLKINIDFGTKLLTSQDKNIVGKLNIKWLHGAIAKNLRAQVDVTLNSISTQFEKFKDYTFNDPTRTFQSEELTIFNDRVDDAGNANIKTDFRIGQIAPGMLKANFQTRAFEEGGDFSIDQFSIPYSPFNYYVGVKTPKGDKARGMLLTDTDHTIEIVTVDFNGKPVTRKNLSASVYKVQWRWWWESGSDNLGSYAGSNSHTSILTKNFDTDSNGLGSFDFKIKYPEWGRYLIRITDKDGHSCGKTVYVDWPGWAGRSQRDNPGGASMLMFSADKEKYQVGEKAKISFPSSLGGRALVSIENGTQVQDMFWVETTDKETIFEFEIKNSMTPNVFIHITLLQKHNQTINDLPIRLYGVIPITVEDAATRLKPVLSMPKELRSEEKFTLQVKEENGKPMTYTVAIVEEGLLDLTRFKTPDPWSTFYAKEALGVKTWDMYDFVLGAYGGKLEQVFAIGGDESLMDNGKKKANRFKPVVKFIGPFELKANEIKSHNIQLTKYIGAVRTMIIAGNKTAYGFTDQSTVIKNPMMLLATMPRVVGPSEKLKLPVSLFAMDENIKNVEVSISTNSLFEILGEKTKTLEIKETGEYDLSFDIAANANLGIGKIKVKASSGQLTTDYDIEIDVRPSNPKITRSYSAVIKSGESWEQATQAFGINGTNAASLEISSLAPIDFGRRLKYLLDYPHGCIEQTTSTAFPQLFLGNVMELSTEEQNKTQKNIEAALERFISFQLPNGGFSYWPGNNAPSDWGTSYAGHFLLEAEKKGYSLPIGMKDHWIDYQSQKARNWSNKKENWSMLDQAYRLYTLALADAPEIGAMNRLRELPNLSKQAMWRLAAAYALAGKQNIATAMIDNKSWQLDEDKQYAFTYGSMTRDYAMILETYSLLKRQNDALPLMEMISKKLSSNEWMSTQASAYSLIAMVKFAGDEKLKNKMLDFEFSLAGLSDQVKTDKSIKKLSKVLTNKDISSTKVTNHGESLIYANLFIEGIPLENTLQAESKNLAIQVQYQTLDNKDIDPTKIEQGMDFKAVVTIQNPGILGDYKDLALTQIFPSGWEIHNTRMFSAGSAQEMDTPDYQDIRDDRIYSYLDIKAGKSKSFVVLLNAAYIGEYFLPSVVCEAMYDSRINARTEGKWVKVIEN